MFGSKRRQERREDDIREAAQLAASMRTNFGDALEEVLKSKSRLTLRVGKITISGSDDSCSVDGSIWHGPEDFLRQVEQTKKLLGRRYDVVGRAWISIDQMSFGLAVDLASGYSIPRTHAMEHDTKLAEVRNAADLKFYGRSLASPKNHWISIWRC